jgi:peptidoglycan/xylan/chitin deacetylase (PgdA/CDA1 family)
MDLSVKSDAELRTSLRNLEDAFVSIVGSWPNYFRPPYLTTTTTSLATLKEFGYKVLNVDIDTNDWQESHVANPQLSLDAFKAGLDAGGSLVLEHDVHASTANLLVPLLISELQSRGLKSVTAGECLGEDRSFWYSAPRAA